MEGKMMIQAKEIAGGQWQRFRDALKSADLPADDIDLPGRTFFEFTLDSETVAWGGFETHGTDGLGPSGLHAAHRYLRCRNVWFDRISRRSRSDHRS